MQVDFSGRIRNINLPRSQGLRALFEALVNSIDSISDSNEQGRIDITIHRDESQQQIENMADRSLQPITSFEVIDTGLGFTDTNWEAFQQCDTTAKASKGGKGIGRLLFLKAFEKADVKSTFLEKDGWKTRKFSFALPEGIFKDALDATPDQGRKTTVHLMGFREEYRQESPKTLDAVASRIVEHCLSYFILGTCPAELFLHDGPKSLDLWEVYQSHIADVGDIRREIVKTHGLSFDVTHVLVSTSAENKNRIHYCAQNRQVSSSILQIPDLPPSIQTAGGNNYHYAAYISGQYLDDHVTPERTGFIGHREPKNLLTENTIWEDLDLAVIESSKKYLEPFIEPVKKEKERKIKNFVQEKAPQYRPLLKRKPEVIEKIAHNLDDKSLDLELYKCDQEYRIELKESGEQIIKGIESVESLEEFSRGVEEFIEKWNEVGMAELAQYVAYRKAVLMFLSKSLEQKEDGSYKREDAIHQIIFPLKKTSDDVPAEQMNLWVLDDRLIYHRYLASDQSFKKMDGVIDLESGDRPDIIIFHSASAFVESSDPPHTAISIIEFKRPARKDYPEDENPISQLINYARELRRGTATDSKGRPIPGVKGLPFYGYLVCDLTAKLREMAETAGLVITPDEMGYVGYNPNVQMHIQVLSFDKVVGDAKKRNSILFNKLNIPL